VDDQVWTLVSFCLRSVDMSQFLVAKEDQKPLRVAHVKDGHVLAKNDVILEMNEKLVWNRNEMEFSRIAKEEQVDAVIRQTLNG
jgi:hypothetical protein